VSSVLYIGELRALYDITKHVNAWTGVLTGRHADTRSEDVMTEHIKAVKVRRLHVLKSEFKSYYVITFVPLHFCQLIQLKCQMLGNLSCGFTCTNTTKTTSTASEMEHTAIHATFLGLPAELRNSIYEFMLTTCTKEPLHIEILLPNCKSKAPIGIMRTAENGVDVRGSNILRASKFTYREARSILYSHNVFLFMEPQALRIFAVCIKDSKAMLRHVQLKIGRSNTTRAALKALCPTPNLRNLDVGRFLDTSNPRHVLVQLHGNEELREATVAFADAGQTVDECEERFAATRLCAIAKGSGKWEVVID